MKFELSEGQTKYINNWKKSLDKKHDYVGTYSYKFIEAVPSTPWKLTAQLIVERHLTHENLIVDWMSDYLSWPLPNND